MGASRAADYVIIQDVGICDICGAPGFEECLAVCSQCSERAEHVYCMQTLCDAVPLNWVCESCKKRTVFESVEVQNERDSCANSMTEEKENKKTTFSHRKAYAKTSQRQQKCDNNRQRSEEFETETTIEAEHISDGFSKKLSRLILSAEDGLSECTSDKSSFKSHADCSSPATPDHQSDLERVCHSLKVDGRKTASNLESNDSSAVDAPQYLTIPPVTSGALEHPPPMSSNPLSPSPPLSRSAEHFSPLKAWNGLQDNAEVIDMEIDADSGNENGVAVVPVKFPSLSPPNQPDFPWTLLESPSFTDLELPPLPPGSPLVQPSPPATPLESGTCEELRFPPLPRDSPCMQPSCLQTSSQIVDCTDSPLPPLPPGSPPAQPSPPSTPGDRVNGSRGSLSSPSSRPPTPPQAHQGHAPESNLKFSAVLKHKSTHWEGDCSTGASLKVGSQQDHALDSNLNFLAVSKGFPAVSKLKSCDQEGDCSSSVNLGSLASGLDKKRDKKRSQTASCAENNLSSMSRKAPRYGLQSDIFEILIGAAEPSRSKMRALTKKQDLEHERQSNDSADVCKPLCSTSRSDQQVKDDKKNGTSVGHLCKTYVKSPEKRLLHKPPSIVCKTRIESGLKGNEEPLMLSSDISTRCCSDLACPSIVEQTVLNRRNEDTSLVPWVPSKDVRRVSQQSSIDPGAASSSILNGMGDKQDISRSLVDKNRIGIVGGSCNVDDVRTCENARDNMCMQQLSCLPLFPAVESSAVLDRTGILVDVVSEEELLSDQSWQVMPLVQQLEEPWYKPPLPNLNDPPFPPSLDQSLIASPDDDFALTMRLPQYRKHGNIWITIESDTRTCYDENVELSLSCWRS